jgi:hypothetical protein
LGYMWDTFWDTCGTPVGYLLGHLGYLLGHLWDNSTSNLV